MSEQVKLFDIAHFEHTVYSGYYQQGQTIYNADNIRTPVRKFGKAPQGLLDKYPFWFTMDKAENDLKMLGFTRKDEVVWEK